MVCGGVGWCAVVWGIQVGWCAVVWDRGGVMKGGVKWDRGGVMKGGIGYRGGVVRVR